MQTRRRKTVVRYSSRHFFFPAASLYAALYIPLSVLGLTTGQPMLPGFSTMGNHAHEMLFGFALAVVAGFLVNQCSRAQLMVMAASWTVARVAFLLAPAHWLSAAANILFVMVLVSMTAPQFLGAARKWRNRSVALVLSALALTLAGFHIALFTQSMDWQSLTLTSAVLLLAMLMLFMGGRIIAPAYAGHIRQQGGYLAARVQPALEGALLILVLMSIILELLVPGHFTMGALLVAAGLLALARLWRWQPWRCLDRADLLCLAIGYLWLALGLILIGGNRLYTTLPSSVVLHAITIGALGTLTITVMARTWWIKAKRHPEAISGLIPAVSLIALGALLRMVFFGSSSVLTLASILWSLAFLILLGIFIQGRPVSR